MQKSVTRRHERKLTMKTIRVPIRAEYKIVDGEPVLQSAEYAEVDARLVAEMIFKSIPNGTGYTDQPA